jgi:hypothetical protein
MPGDAVVVGWENGRQLASFKSMSTLVYAIAHPELPPFPMSDRFRHEIAYFMSVPGKPGVPLLAEGEYWVALAEAREWLDSGVISLVSPLDSEHQTEVELSEEHEAWLEWMLRNQVEHIRLQSAEGIRR